VEFIAHSKHSVNLADWDRYFSVAAGTALAISAIRGSWSGGLVRALAGAELIRRGLTGRSILYEALGMRTAPLGQGSRTTSVPYELGVRVDRAVTVNKPRPEVYRFFRNLSNFPQFMRNVRSVTETTPMRSHWVVRGPAGRTLEWDAVIHNERENEILAWRTLPNADVDHAGSVLFRDVPGDRGTEVRIELQYNPPAGIAGALISKLWGEEPTQQIEHDLRRLKQILEAGEVLTTEGQPQGREVPVTPESSWRPGRSRHHHAANVVEIASEASFPASDAPSYSL